MGLVREKWLVSESFGKTRTKEKNRKGLGSRKEKVEGTGVVGNLGGCWSAGSWSTGAKFGTVEGTLEVKSFGYQNFIKKN